ncbi:MAG: GNAT family N-acetyltransferase [Proteobacteria bacterium]|nr:MAG: GNAT family N-acetyltransferase [Pseudomonadota bacterium]
MKIRGAKVEEYELLSSIALKSKAHWGYSSQDLARWEQDLTVTAASVAKQPTFIAQIDGDVAGFFQLSIASGVPELEHFWVRPGFMGEGVGRALLGHALREVANRGYDELFIDADPNAEDFYVACGAERVAVKAAPIIGQIQRVRPQLVLSVNAS